MYRVGSLSAAARSINVSRVRKPCTTKHACLRVGLVSFSTNTSTIPAVSFPFDITETENPNAINAVAGSQDRYFDNERKSGLGSTPKVLEQINFEELTKIKVVEQLKYSEARAKHNELMARQLKIEEEQLVEASALYGETFQSLSGMGRFTSLKSAQRLLLNWYEPLAETLSRELEDIKNGVPGADRKVYKNYLDPKIVTAEKLAIMTLTTTLNSILRTGNLGEKLSNIAMDIGGMCEGEWRVYWLKKDDVVPTWQRKKLVAGISTSSRPVSSLKSRLDNLSFDVVKHAWPQEIKVKVGALLVSKLIEVANKLDGEGKPAFLYTNNFHQNGSTGFAKRQGFLKMDPLKYKEFTSLSVKDSAFLMPRYLPMLVPPQKWNNRENVGAYLTLKAPIIKATSSMQTTAVRRAKMDSVLESLDYLGQIGWRINPLVLNVVEACVQQKITLAGLPNCESVPLPNESECKRSVKEILASLNESLERSKAMLLDAQQRIAGKAEKVKKEEGKKDYKNKTYQQKRIGEKDKAEKFEKDAELNKKQLEYLTKMHESTTEKILKQIKELQGRNSDELILDDRLFKYKVRRVQQMNGELHSLRCDLAIKLKIAGKFKNDIMYFPHNIDFRGRAYPIPPNLSHLGNDLCRGIVLFDKAKPLGREGLKWLKVHVANLCGYNKVSLDDRVAWTDEHMDLIRDSVAQPLEGKRWWAEQESPFQVLAAGAEIIAAIDSGDSENYLCRLPVHQDGSCNGLQHYAGLGRDEQGGSAVNLVPHEKPQDVYSSVLANVLQKIEQDCASDVPSKERQCARMVNGLVSRKVIKQTVMTSVYGVTATGARAQVQARLEEVMGLNAAAITPEKEREISQAAAYLADLTLVSLEEMFKSARSIMDWLSDCAKLVASDPCDNAMAWITPLGLPVIQPYRKMTMHTVSTVMQSITLASNSDVLPISMTKQKTAFPPNYVHSMDATHMMMTSLKMKDLGLNFAAVHDSYWTHPCDIPVMNECLRDAFVELYSFPLLEDLLQSLRVRFPGVAFKPVPNRGTLDIKRVKDSKYFFH